MSLTLVTTTRNRPLCFSLLEKWMATQTRWWDQWLVVNDGTDPGYHYTLYQEVVYRDYTGDDSRSPWLQSICLNWLEAVPYIRGDKIIVIEDDDYYAPNYVQTVSDMLDDAALVGISRDAYYKLPTKHYKWCGNTDHASLACTGFRREVLTHVERVANTFGSVFLDMYLWAEWGSEQFPGTRKLVPQPHSGRKLHVGMKNMPGAFGLGLGHQKPDGWNLDHTSFKVLREWVGPDAAQEYTQVWRNHFVPKVRTP